MLKKNLQAMSEAITTYRDLLAREMRGPSDSESAMHRIQAKYGIDYWTQWGLRFRPPKKVSADLIERVRQAYLATLEQSVRRDIARLEIEAAKGADDAAFKDLVAEAQGVLAKIQERRMKA